MSAGTKIQWCHATVNFWWGCCEVSTGCRECYAKRMAQRLSRGRATWGPDGLRWLRVGEACYALLQLEKRAVKKKTRFRVFINSMSDTFEDRRDLDGARGLLFIIARCVPNLDLLLLTKRPENIQRLTPADWHAGNWPGNVWIGTSVENQDAARRLAALARFPAPVRFASCEPLVGPLDLTAIGDDGVNRFDALRGLSFCEGRNEPAETRKLDWVIVGGESGQRARPCDVDWIRGAIRQGREFEIPVFVKQLGRRPVEKKFVRRDHLYDTGMRWRRLELRDGHGGDMMEWPEDLRVRELPSASILNGVQA